MGLCDCGDVGIYKCPRCGIPYCCLSCYKSHSNNSCSELFYKEQVEEELKQRRVSRKDKEKMREVLQRQACDIQSDSESEENITDLLKDLDLKSETELWEMLTEHEKQGFLRSIKTGAITTLLKPKQLWWDNPKIISSNKTKFPLFGSLFKGTPSPYLIYSVVQSVLSYITCEMIYIDKNKILCDYWATYCLLSGENDKNVYNDMSAVCAVFVERADSTVSGVQKFVSITSIFESLVKVLNHGKLGLEMCFSELIVILKKLCKALPAEERYEKRRQKKQLEFYGAWSRSSHFDAMLLAQTVSQITIYINNLNSLRKTFEKDSKSLKSSSNMPLIEEIC